MRKCVFLFLLGTLTLFTSCLTPKKVVYFEDMQTDSLYKALPQVEIRIKKEDKLSIVVKSKNPELAAPFNLEMGAYQVNTDGEISSSSVSSSKEKGYVVSQTGDIEFPVLGVIHVEGLTKNELAGLIKQRLIAEDLINDPLVTVDVLNLRIAVMGEVNKVGVVPVTDGRITLLEALSRAGGLTNNGRTDHVVIVREEGQTRKMIVADLGSVSVFDSSAFYLQQNDVVYVQPRFARTTDTESRNWRYYTSSMGLISLVVSLFVLFK